MTRTNRGFTLIELVTVIVILGALAAVAVPQFIDLQDDAAQAATEQVAGNLSSASAVNLAGGLAGDTAATTVQACGNIGNLLQGGLPSDYTLYATNTDANRAQGSAFTCSVANQVESKTVQFQAFQVNTNPS